MNSSLTNKVLGFLFVTLFILVVGELVYFFYLSNNTKQKLSTVTTGNISITTIQNNPSKSFPEPTIDEIATITLKNKIKGIAKGTAIDSNIITQSKGKIIKIQDKNIDKSPFIGGYNPILQVTLQTESSTNPQTFSINFDKNEFDVTYIQPTEDSNNNLKLLNINDLKEGQTIKISEKFSLKTYRVVQNLIFIEK